MSKYAPLWEEIARCEQPELTLSFAQVTQILGFELDHSFLNYKSELAAYGWQAEKISMKNKNIRFAKTK